MIDYDKLREAYELADQAKIAIRTQTRHVNGKYRKFLGWIMDFSADNSFESIDDLITKLKELAQPEPKYKEAWYLDGRNPKCTKVLNKSGYRFCDESDPLSLGRVMFDTKSKLIEAQIEYWSDMHDQYNRPETWEEKHIKSVLESRRTECEHYHKIPGLGNDFMCSDCDKYIIPSKECQHEPDPEQPRSLIGDKCRQHESDGKLYANYDFSNSQPYKCAKCGEFYR